jgi:hypothetical protein
MLTARGKLTSTRVSEFLASNRNEALPLNDARVKQPLNGMFWNLRNMYEPVQAQPHQPERVALGALAHAPQPQVAPAPQFGPAPVVRPAHQPGRAESMFMPYPEPESPDSSLPASNLLGRWDAGASTSRG